MCILITGSSGLIGSALKRALQLLHIETIGCDNRVDTMHPDYGDILHPSTLFPKADKVNGIVHLAAVSRVIDGEKNPIHCWETNVEGTKNVIESALTSRNRPWIIYASSREVYGQQEVFPVRETAPLSPVNIYGESKFKAEQIIQQVGEKNLQTAIVRFSNVFGSVHDYPDRVVPAFCRAAVEENQIRVDGKEHLFDFTYLGDVIQGILSLIYLLMQKKRSLPPVHLTRGVPVSLDQIAQIAWKASNYTAHIIEGVSRSFDVSKFWGDTTLSKSMLNWSASVSIEEGMHRLINQYRIFHKIKNPSINSESEDSTNQLAWFK